MPAYSNRELEEGRQRPQRQASAACLSVGRPQLTDEDLAERKAAKAYKKGQWIIRKGLGDPATSTEWFVCKPFRKTYDLAPGCPKPERFKSGGFATLPEAIALFEQL